MFGPCILIILQFVGWQCIGRASPCGSKQLGESPSLVSHDTAYELYITPLGHLSSPHGPMHDISLISKRFLFSLFLVWMKESEQQQVEWTHPRFTRQSAEIDVSVSERSVVFTSNSEIIFHGYITKLHLHFHSCLFVLGTFILLNCISYYCSYS